VRSTEFLDLYKQLEDELEIKYSHSKRRYSSVIFEYINSEESTPIREKLDLCREIRNLMTHNADVGGVPVVEPSAPVVEALREALVYIRRPPLALDFATPSGKICSAGLSDGVLRVMADMEKRGLSHIPILERGKFIGVFSVSTVFSCVLHDPDVKITEKTTVRDLARLLPPENHIDNFAFVDRKITSLEARKMFEKIKSRNRRLSVLFITEHGRQEEALLGMLTPWDLMKEEQ
jgi:predicted transcriptional regulator